MATLNSMWYLLRTWSETYLALKFSIMARLAWSISFWASPSLLWERFTACKYREILSNHHSNINYGEHAWGVIQTHQGCDVSMGYIIWVLLPKKVQLGFRNSTQLMLLKVRLKYRYSHLCQHITDDFSIFVLCNVRELKQWQQTSVDCKHLEGQWY